MGLVLLRIILFFLLYSCCLVDWPIFDRNPLPVGKNYFILDPKLKTNQNRVLFLSLTTLICLGDLGHMNCKGLLLSYIIVYCKVKSTSSRRFKSIAIFLFWKCLNFLQLSEVLFFKNYSCVMSYSLINRRKISTLVK